MAAHPLPQTFFERRISLRLLAYWEKLRQDRLMPAEGDIVPDDICDVWDSCFLINVKKAKPPHYQYNYLGRSIIEAYGGLSHGDPDVVIAPHAGMIDDYTTVVQTLKPLINSGEFSNRQGHAVKYRQCLLPLGEGDEVTAILGALHLKIFPV